MGSLECSSMPLFRGRLESPFGSPAWKHSPVDKISSGECRWMGEAEVVGETKLDRDDGLRFQSGGGWGVRSFSCSGPKRFNIHGEIRLVCASESSLRKSGI
jgi:hypothetical protein